MMGRAVQSSTLSGLQINLPILQQVSIPSVAIACWWFCQLINLKSHDPKNDMLLWKCCLNQTDSFKNLRYRNKYVAYRHIHFLSADVCIRFEITLLSIVPCDNS